MHVQVLMLQAAIPQTIFMQSVITNVWVYLPLGFTDVPEQVINTLTPLSAVPVKVKHTLLPEGTAGDT